MLFVDTRNARKHRPRVRVPWQIPVKTGQGARMPASAEKSATGAYCARQHVDESGHHRRGGEQIAAGTTQAIDIVNAIRFRRRWPQAFTVATCEAPRATPATTTTSTPNVANTQASGNQRSAHAARRNLARVSQPSCDAFICATHTDGTSSSREHLLGRPVGSGCTLLRA